MEPDNLKTKDGSPSCSSKVSPNNSPVKDKLFDPSIDMLINDFDDERTLEEEEALAAADVMDTAAELSNLEKESHMPLEELLALYGYENSGKHPVELDSSGDEEGLSECEEIHDNTQTVVERRRNPPRKSKLALLYEPICDDVMNDSKNISSVSKISEDEDEDSDHNEEHYKVAQSIYTIMVGSDYQVKVPKGFLYYDNMQPANDKDDKLIWNPQRLCRSEVEEYLKKAYDIYQHAVPNGDLIRDDEEALYTLHKCGYEVEAALKDLRVRQPLIPKTDNPANDVRWLEEKPTVNGTQMQTCEKNFLQLHQNNK
ncbi:mesoderm induction early response protein 1-like [Anthonomus grandis grandis]|uniref:mesoderm induction early response protein 1-like n=1 Tax=Anthonomus grandis grandis TaxID=2921223 RepID=UPI002165AD44|nr:mesoderm induction early response protein 1-like [Anthonomus grandis grandis]XP_050314505.1 mesoderm induction early response protein 1-like [Anthonomus grandis grandis]